MPQLIWSPRVLLDVQRLYRFLAAKNQEAAKRPITAIRRGVTMLTSQPAAGRPVEGLEAEFRDWIIAFGDSGYVVRYRLDSQHVVILVVRHQKEAGF